MKHSFFGANVRNQNEVTMLILTILQAFFIGVFYSLFLIGAHVLFLQSWEPAEIPPAYIISAIFGIILFTIYSFLSNRINIRYFTFINLVVIFIINLLLFLFYDTIINYSIYGIPIMLPFTLVIPLTLMTMLTFRQSMRNILLPNQHRRMYLIIRNSLMTGIIVASYTLVGALYIHWDILLITGFSALFIGLATILQLPINYYHRTSGAFSHVLRRSSILRSRFYEMFYTRYTFILILFVVLSAITGFVIHYHFLEETRANYSHTIGLAKFFGFFTGTMFLFVFIFEKFLVRKILYSYDSPYSLVLIPVMLAVASLVTVILDLLLGQSTIIARFSFGFLMVVMLKIGYETTNEAIELPSLRVLFRTLDLRFTYSVISRMEGTFRMVALLIAGLTLSVLLLLKLDKSFFIDLTILILTLIWFPVGILLVKSYQSALRENIKRLKASKRAIEQELLNTDEKTHSLINSPDPVKSINTLSIVEKIEPLTHEKHLVSLLGTDSPELRNYLFERIEENALLSSLPKLKDIHHFNHQKQHTGNLSRLINRFEIKLSVGISKDSIDNLINSKNLTDRMLAAELIGNSGKQDWGDFLLHLSRDIEPEVKLASVKAMARLGNPKHSYILIGYLTTPIYYPYAFEALIKIGDPALPHMEQSFLLPDADNTLLSRIVRIYGKIGSFAAIELLLDKIENQNRTIIRQALLALREAKFQASPANINRILNDTVRLINIMSWNFAAYSNLGKSDRYTLLKEAFESEIAENYNTLYHLLALAYNSTSIGNIKNLLYEGSDTDISFAIELLDQIVNEEIKQVFFPVVENITVKERFKQLQYFFPAIKESPEELIEDIIIRDFNLISLYAKACAIFSLLNLKKPYSGQVLIACMFHPNQLIRESAAYVMDKLEPAGLESVYSRLEPSVVNEIKTTFLHACDESLYLLLDRIRFIKKCKRMKKISEDVLLEVSRALELQHLVKDEEFLIKRDDVHFAFMIIIEGTAQVKISSGKVLTFVKNDVIYSDIFVEDNTFSLRALTDLKLYSLEQEVLNALMFDYIDFRNSILEIVEEA
jgi:AAA family ATP:ADP antiporter